MLEILPSGPWTMRLVGIALLCIIWSVSTLFLWIAVRICGRRP